MHHPPRFLVVIPCNSYCIDTSSPLKFGTTSCIDPSSSMKINLPSTLMLGVVSVMSSTSHLGPSSLRISSLLSWGSSSSQVMCTGLCRFCAATSPSSRAILTNWFIHMVLCEKESSD
ncbi:hypothetical protein V6N11_049959 [Hibiscus sabdariffa]|uniref:Uncharacterized protein n=1 Tax=Hibiscus sabdariffa TaxID=183260 RepID=A0ABR2T8H6_9ROSI